MAKITQELKKQVLGYVMGGFGLVAGLAWNDAIRGLIDYLYPLEQSGLPAKFVYAAIVTTVLVAVSIYLIRPPEEKS